MTDHCAWGRCRKPGETLLCGYEFCEFHTARVFMRMLGDRQLHQVVREITGDESIGSEFATTEKEEATDGTR